MTKSQSRHRSVTVPSHDTVTVPSHGTLSYGTQSRFAVTAASHGAGAPAGGEVADGLVRAAGRLHLRHRCGGSRDVTERT